MANRDEPKQPPVQGELPRDIASPPASSAATSGYVPVGADQPINFDLSTKSEAPPVTTPGEEKVENLHNLISQAFSNVLANAPKPKPQDQLRFDSSAAQSSLFSMGPDAAEASQINEDEGVRRPLMIGNVALVDFLNPWRVLGALWAIVFITFCILYLAPPVWFQPIKAQIQYSVIVIRKTATGRVSIAEAIQELQRPAGKKEATPAVATDVLNDGGLAANEAPAGKGACQVRVAEYTQQVGLGKTTKKDGLQAAHCYLLLDDPLRSLPITKRYTQLVAPTTSLVASKPDDVEGFFAAEVAMLRLGRLEEAAKITEPLCAQWKMNADCLAKLMYVHAAGFVAISDQGAKKMAADASATTPSLDVLFSVTAGEIADRAGDFARARAHFEKALRGALKLNSFYRKHAIEAYAFAAFRNEQAQDLAKAQSLAMQLLVTEGRGARTKVLLLAALNTKKAGEVLGKILATNDMNLRLRGDNRMLAILGDAAIRRNQSLPFGKYAQSNSDHLRVSYKASPSVIATSEQWRGRALMGAGKSKEALQVLEAVVQVTPKSGQAWHLRGVALAQVWNAKGAGLETAEKSLETAAGFAPNWQTFLALANVYGRNGKAKKQADAIARAKPLVTNDVARTWLRIAEIELLSNKGSANQALVEVDKLLNSNPSSTVAMSAKLGVLRRHRREKEAIQVERKIDELQRNISALAGAESRLNPMGPLSFL